jgi:hypothetical protein
MSVEQYVKQQDLTQLDEAYRERDLMIRANELMEQEIEKLTAALRFYARSGVVSPKVDDEIREDGGETARVALAQITPKGNPK